jgi:hypothetical protein
MLLPPGVIIWPPAVTISGRSWGLAGFQMEYSAIFQGVSSQLPGGLHAMSTPFCNLGTLHTNTATFYSFRLFLPSFRRFSGRFFISLQLSAAFPQNTLLCFCNNLCEAAILWMHG